MTRADQRITPEQPSDPAIFAPLTVGESSILCAHLNSGLYKQSAVYPTLSEPWQETAGLLDDLHAVWKSAFEGSAPATKEAELADREPGAGA
jgi:hypothetical protein